jgi:hypothetical protein
LYLAEGSGKLSVGVITFEKELKEIYTIYILLKKKVLPFLSKQRAGWQRKMKWV